MPAARKTQPRRIGIVIYPDVQALDVGGPHEVFAMASTLQKQRSGEAAYDVFTIGQSLKPVEMTSGMRLLPDYRFDNCPFPLDTLIVPGSEFVEQVIENAALLRWL